MAPVCNVGCHSIRKYAVFYPAKNGPDPKYAEHAQIYEQRMTTEERHAAWDLASEFRKSLPADRKVTAKAPMPLTYRDR